MTQHSGVSHTISRRCRWSQWEKRKERGRERNHALVRCTRILQNRRPNDPQSKSPILGMFVFKVDICLMCAENHSKEVEKSVLYINLKTMMVNFIFLLNFMKHRYRCDIFANLLCVWVKYYWRHSFTCPSQALMPELMSV